MCYVRFVMPMMSRDKGKEVMMWRSLSRFRTTCKKQISALNSAILRSETRRNYIHSHKAILFFARDTQCNNIGLEQRSYESKGVIKIAIVITLYYYYSTVKQRKSALSNLAATWTVY